MTSAPTAEVLDGTAEEVGSDLEPAASQAPPVLAVTPQVQAVELVERLNVIRDAMHHAMQEGVDYGAIPGTNKPTLLKPGSEKLGVLFQLDVQLDNEKSWGPGDHLTVVSKATAYHAPSGTRLGFGEGVCTTRERKYAYRKQERLCPTCAAAAVIKGKAEFGGGWLCWKKKDGCGAKFSDGDQAIEGQVTGEMENPDLPDLWNTVLKMAEKRARVDVVLAVTGASALFTQDAEDLNAPGGDVPPAAVTEPSSPRVGADTAARVMTAIGGALDNGQVEPEGLAALFAQAGAHPAAINAQAVNELTDQQALTLLGALGAIA